MLRASQPQSYDYDSLQIATSRAVQAPRIWDILGRSGLKSIIIGVPQTYPVQAMNGILIAGMLAPDTRGDITWPSSVRSEIMGRFPGYALDIPDFRSLPPEKLAALIREMTRTRFAVLRHLLHTRTWDFAMMVEIGLDRLHHGFWHYWDITHRLYPGTTSLASVIPEYYSLLDEEIRETVAMLPDDTAVVIVSDHGAQPMKGGIRINEWLIRNGFLTLKRPPVSEEPLTADMVDWKRTRAWGEGGYFGRIFLNVAGREPLGIIPPENRDRVREELAGRLESMTEPSEITCGTGERMGNQVIFPDRHFPVVRGNPPDLMVYFGQLAWRSLSGVGPSPGTFGDGMFTRKNDRGPDGANHDFFGIALGNIPAVPGTFDVPGNWNITEVASFIRKYYGLNNVEYHDGTGNENSNAI
ncbi:MAG TPA: alkaline phosphatase family protein [bacterium]|nr:alkaline phosphatase family protein [bacterium]